MVVIACYYCCSSAWKTTSPEINGSHCHSFWPIIEFGSNLGMCSGSYSESAFLSAPVVPFASLLDYRSEGLYLYYFLQGFSL